MPAKSQLLFLFDNATDDAIAQGIQPVAVRADPSTPHINVMDLGVTRGDGIFEALDVVHGAPQAVDAHLARFRHSAELLDLPLPSTEAWRSVIHEIVAAAPAHDELTVKIVMTRGIENNAAHGCTGWAYAESGPDYRRARVEGIHAVTLDRGYRHDVAKTSPWLLQGAKTLSYAINKAALREAARRGANDVIFVSSDGYVLEGPQATLILQHGDSFVTPATDQGILAGTTQAAFFDWCAAAGAPTEYRRVTVDELTSATSLWLASSLRQIVPITTLDSVPREFDTAVNTAANEYLLARRS